MHHAAISTWKPPDDCAISWFDTAARPSQRPPAWDWRTWLILAGRGWGKTRVGAEWLRSQQGGAPRMGIIAPTFADARDICVEGESGLQSICRPGEITRWNRSIGELEFRTGAKVKLFSGDKPDRLRGPQHYALWFDELAAFQYMQAAWDMAMFGLRLGDTPRAVVTTTPRPLPLIKRLLGDGSSFGVKFEYAEQPSPDGLAQAFIIGKEFIGNDKVALVLGDNIFHGARLDESLKTCTDPEGGIVFAYQVSDPERYGVVEFDDAMLAVSIEEKPAKPKSNYAVVGLYFYDNDVIEIAKSIKPSDRGELEITTVNEEYLKKGKLKVQIMDRGSAWLDTGTFESMNDASEYISVIEKRTGLKIGCPEEVAWRNGWINDQQLAKIAEPLKKSGYGKYLESLKK